jgi:hypothetical protein
MACSQDKAWSSLQVFRFPFDIYKSTIRQHSFMLDCRCENLQNYEKKYKGDTWEYGYSRGRVGGVCGEGGGREVGGEKKTLASYHMISALMPISNILS